MNTIEEGLVLYNQKRRVINSGLFSGKRMVNILNSRTLKEFKARLENELKRIELKKTKT